MYTEGMLFDGRYLLKERKGRGTFGEVWRAIDTEVNVELAVKIYVAMDAKGLDEFRKEFQLSCNLINSNLLHINRMEVCQQDSCPYLVMPYCPRSAASMVGQLSENEIWHFVLDVANGLAYLHEQVPPIIHQDIKPDNVLQTKTGEFVITDFGISKQLRGTMRSATGDSRGAIAYMGPERFTRDYKTIKASDIWSLGASVYEMATGNLPFEGKGGVLMDAGAEIPDLPASFSSELNALLRSCMSKDPWDRPSATVIHDIAEDHIKGRTRIIAPAVEDAQIQSESCDIDAVPARSGLLKIMIWTCSALIVILLIVIGNLIFDGQSVNVSQEETTSDVAQPAKKEVKHKTTQPASNTSSVSMTEATPVFVENNESSMEPEPDTESSSSSVESNSSITKTGNIDLGYAVWEGSVSDGKPNGNGKMTFQQDYDLQGHSIKSGDVVEGSCLNGQLEGFCTWHSQDGKKTIMLGN